MIFKLCLLAVICAIPVIAQLDEDAKEVCEYKLIECEVSWKYPGHAITIYSLAGLTTNGQMDVFCRNYSDYIQCNERLKQECTDQDVLKIAYSRLTFHRAVKDALCSDEGRKVVISSGACWQKDLSQLNRDCRREHNVMDRCTNVQGRKDCKAESVRDCGQGAMALLDKLDDAWHTSNCPM